MSGEFEQPAPERHPTSGELAFRSSGLGALLWDQELAATGHRRLRALYGLPIQEITDPAVLEMLKARVRQVISYNGRKFFIDPGLIDRPLHPGDIASSEEAVGLRWYKNLDTVHVLPENGSLPPQIEVYSQIPIDDRARASAFEVLDLPREFSQHNETLAEVGHKLMRTVLYGQIPSAN